MTDVFDLAAEVDDLRMRIADLGAKYGELQHRAAAGMVLCVHCGGEGQWSGETDDGQEHVERCGYCDGTGWTDSIAEASDLRARAAALADIVAAAQEAHLLGLAYNTAAAAMDAAPTREARVAAALDRQDALDALVAAIGRRDAVVELARREAVTP